MDVGVVPLGNLLPETTGSVGCRPAPFIGPPQSRVSSFELQRGGGGVCGIKTPQRLPETLERRRRLVACRVPLQTLDLPGATDAPLKNNARLVTLWIGSPDLCKKLGFCARVQLQSLGQEARISFAVFPATLWCGEGGLLAKCLHLSASDTVLMGVWEAVSLVPF